MNGRSVTAAVKYGTACELAAERHACDCTRIARRPRACLSGRWRVPFSSPAQGFEINNLLTIAHVNVGNEKLT
jgi:hypothetical protein